MPSFLVVLSCLCMGPLASGDVLLNIIHAATAREQELASALGPYKFYVYGGGAFDALSTDLLSGWTDRHGKKRPFGLPTLNEYRAPIWIHRALLADPHRTHDPSEADLFFVPAYLQASFSMSDSEGKGRQTTHVQHEERLKKWGGALHASSWFQRRKGADHLFACGDVNMGWSHQHGVVQVRKFMGDHGYIGTFEMSGSWLGDWDLTRAIVIPYVAADEIAASSLGFMNKAAAAAVPPKDSGADSGGVVAGGSGMLAVGRETKQQTSSSPADYSTLASPVASSVASSDLDAKVRVGSVSVEAAVASEAKLPRKVSLYFAAAQRPNAVKWANCSRGEVKKLSKWPHAVVYVHTGPAPTHRKLQHTNVSLPPSSSSSSTLPEFEEEPRSMFELKLQGQTFRDTQQHRQQQQQQQRSRSLRHSETSFAAHMFSASVCPLVCGDTPTSRRTVDAYLAGCVPLFVGTRLWGRCDPPCVPGWGWRVAGREFPHLPWHGLWIDWSRFPLLDEMALVSGSPEDALSLLRHTLLPLSKQAGGNQQEALTRARAYMFATRRSLIYGSGECHTSNTFGLASRRLVEAALFKIRNIAVVAATANSTVDRVDGEKEEEEEGGGGFEPLEATVKAAAAPYSASMKSYFDKAAKMSARAKKRAENEAAAAAAATAATATS